MSDERELVTKIAEDIADVLDREQYARDEVPNWEWQDAVAAAKYLVGHYAIAELSERDEWRDKAESIEQAFSSCKKVLAQTVAERDAAREKVLKLKAQYAADGAADRRELQQLRYERDTVQSAGHSLVESMREASYGLNESIAAISAWLGSGEE